MAAEAFFSAFHFRAGSRSLLRSSRPGTFSVEDLAQYRAAWSQPGALKSMTIGIARYFAVEPSSRSHRSHSTRILWASAMPFSFPKWRRKSALLRRRRALYFANASHWLQHEEAAGVSELLIDFFRN